MSRNYNFWYRDMSQWSADFMNGSNNDYVLMIEPLYDGKDVGIIRQRKKGLELIWFAHDKDLIIPTDWLSELMNEAKTSLI